MPGGCLCGQIRYTATGLPDDVRPLLLRRLIVIFTRDRPDWAVLPPGLTAFAEMPG